MMHQNKEEMSGKNIKNLDFYAGILFIRSHMYLRQGDSTEHSTGQQREEHTTEHRGSGFLASYKVQLFERGSQSEIMSMSLNTFYMCHNTI
jgi:hypothetical protein